MANIYSSYVSNLQYAGKTVDSKLNGGKARFYPFSFVFSSAGAAPVLYMAKVPAGSRIWNLFLGNSALSASAGVALLIDIGDSGDADRLVAAHDADAAVAFAMKAIRAPASNVGFGYQYTEDTWITGTVASSKTPVDAGTLWGYFVCTSE